MGIPAWSERLSVGDDSVDSCHRDLILSLSQAYRAICDLDYVRAERIVDGLLDSSSIHIQCEDERFSGRDHSFPHETIDDLIQALRRGVRNLVEVEGIFLLIDNVEHALVADIQADRAEIAERDGLADRDRSGGTGQQVAGGFGARVHAQFAEDRLHV